MRSLKSSSLQGRYTAPMDDRVSSRLVPRGHLFTALLLVTALWIPGVAEAEQFEITLTPDDPPRPVVLPRGLGAGELQISVVDLEVEAGQTPPQRVFTMGGQVIPLPARIAAEPLRQRASRIRGREIMFLSVPRFVPSGRVERVTVQISTLRRPGHGLAPVPGGWIDSLPEPEPVLAIVTNRIVAARSRSLERYVRWRESLGLTVVVGIEDDWDLPTEDEPDGRAERIRAWLRQVREELGLGYVLLIGDPSPGTGAGVPMKLTHPMTALVRTYPHDLQEHIDPVPTDHYYAELDGNWDLDSDGNFGEFPEDTGRGGLIWEPDALVGRLPVYWNDTGNLDDVLDAIMNYEAETEPGYRHRVLLPAAFLGYEGGPTPTGGTYRSTSDGATVAQVIARAVPELDPAAEVIRFYEEDGLVPSTYPHELPLEAMILMESWRDGAGLLVAIGHGSPEGIYRSVWAHDHNDDGIPDGEDMSSMPFISTWQLDRLVHAPPGFTFLATCDAGWPEFWDNLGAGSLGHGAIGTVASSRIAVGSAVGFEPDPDMGDADTMAYTFSHLILEGMSAGAALAYLRYGLPSDGWGYESGYPLGGYGWLGKLEFNLYGDPLLSLGRCESDESCAAPSACWNAGRCEDGFCISGGARDDCSDLDEGCVVGVCDPHEGGCTTEPAPDGAHCDDGFACTSEESCRDGVCTDGAPLECSERPGYTGSCSEEAGGCAYERVEEPAEEPEASGSDCDCQAVSARSWRGFSLLLFQ